VLDVNATDHIQLVESINAMIPGIVAQLSDPPDTDQKNPDGTWDAIRVGRKGLILARDWLDRELDRKRKEILAISAVIIQATYRASFNHNEYKMHQAAWTIQSNMRAAAQAKPFQALRKATLTMLPEMHSFTGRVIASRAADSALLNNARNEMNAFLEDNKRLEKMEADERKVAAAEDEYSYKLMDATFSERVEDDKKQFLSMAETAYKNATEKMVGVKAFIDSTQKKGADADARWQKMQTEGVVRAVPLLRQYKSTAQSFNPPSKDSYRFKYSFAYKGAKAVEPKPEPKAKAPAPAPEPEHKETIIEKIEDAAEEAAEAVENVA